jgi:hypothetical protein
MNETDHERALRICCGNESAAQFLCLWAQYCHGVDDIVDGDTKDAEGVIHAFALAPIVYGHPFFLEHISALRVVALLVSNMYADSEKMKTGVGWMKSFADVYRHAGNEMVLAVALICGGYEHMRAVSFEQRATCYDTQHKDEREAHESIG